MNGEISRRNFLYYGAAATAVGLTGFNSARAQSAIPGGRVLRVLLTDADGKPMPEKKVKTIMARDMAGDPLPVDIQNKDGQSLVTMPSEPIQLTCLLNVPGFGEVNCFADNEGRGYEAPGTIHFELEAARTREHRLTQKYKTDGYSVQGDRQFQSYIVLTQHRAWDAPGGVYRSLAGSLAAGERLVLLAAQRRISHWPAPRRDFLFGGLTAGHDRSPDFTKRFDAAFNFGTLSWYTWKQTPSEFDPINYARMDASLQWCVDNHITPKGFGYAYLAKGATPEWLRSWPYEKVLPLYQRVVEHTMRRYDGRIPVAEIINEAHDKTNIFKFDHGQILELTREVCQAARRGSSSVKRMINNCCHWGEYAKKRNPDGSIKWTPWRYLSDCVKANVEFDCIGLQMYYPAYDLMEIDRMLDRFKSFGRPLHVSEMSCNSAPGLDPNSMRPKDDVPGWHGPWTETMQADWLEAMYTLCYSRAEFEAVEWWDIADYDGHFWPHGGLFTKDFKPKESYFRLLALKKNWGLID